MVLNSSPLMLLLVRVNGIEWCCSSCSVTDKSSNASSSLPSPQIFLGLRFLGLVNSLADDGIATRAAGIDMLGGRILTGFDLASDDAVGAVRRDCEKLKVDLALRKPGCLVGWLVLALVYLDGDRGKEDREPLLCMDLIGGAGDTLAGAEDLGFFEEALCSRLFCKRVGDSFTSLEMSKSCS